MIKIFLTTILLSLSKFALKAQAKNFIDQPYIEVAGYADTLVTPNLIYIKIIISEKDNRDRISVEEQESKMITTFKTLNINTENDLSINDLLSNYRFYFLKQKEIIKTKVYILKVTTAEFASKVFIQLEDLGISNTSIFKVDHTDLENLKNICRTKAIENAHKKAIALTKPISQSIGNAIYILDNDTNLDNQLQGRVAGLQIRGMKSNDVEKYEPPKIEFEKIKVSSTLNVKFILK